MQFIVFVFWLMISEMSIFTERYIKKYKRFANSAWRIRGIILTAGVPDLELRVVESKYSISSLTF